MTQRPAPRAGRARRAGAATAGVLRAAALGLLVLAMGACTQPRAAGRYHLRRVAVDPFGGGDASLAPDGRRFVISSRRSGNWDLWTYDLDRDEWKRLTDHAADDHEAQWSPDGRRLAFTSTRAGGKDVWVLSLAGGGLRRISDAPEDEEYPAWSPDGASIVYTGGPWKRRDFFVVPSDGGAPRKVTRRPGHIGACSFVPQGGALICHGYEAGSGDVFLLPLDGRGPVSLTAGDAWDYKANVAGGSGWFAFSRSQDGPSAIWLQPLAGGAAEPLLEAPTPYEDRWPAWDASGTRLLFHRFVERGAAVRVLDLARGELRTLVESDEAPGQASLDPAGRRVVYSAWLEGRQVLRVRDLAGGGPATLDTGAGQASFPRWSPDGRRIAFTRKAAARWEIATVDAGGGGVRTWTEGLAGVHGLDGPLDWSPDGARLLFQADTAPFEADLFVLDTRDGRIGRLTDDEWFDEAPSWGPDGRSVVFMSTRGGDWTWGLFRLGPEGVVEALTEADYTEKNFARLGASGVLTFSMSDERGIERIAQRRADGGLRVLATGPAHSRWPSYSRDGRLLLFTSVERSVEYWLAENVFVNDAPAWPRAGGAAAHAAARRPPTGRPGPVVRATASAGEGDGLGPPAVSCRGPAVGGGAARHALLTASPKDLRHR